MLNTSLRPRAARRGLFALAAAWLLLAPLAALAQPCEPQWGAGVGGGELDRARLHAVASHDPDGDGPDGQVFYAGGEFGHAGGVAAASVAVLSGAGWAPLGGGVTTAGLPGIVRALAMFDPDGPGPLPESLFVGGAFDSAGEAASPGIAMWDGEDWHALGAGLTPSGSRPLPEVLALRVLDPDGDGPLPASLYVAGHFDQAGGQGAFGVARWDGAAWHALGGPGTPGSAALAMFDADGPGPLAPALHAAGDGVRRLDGATWTVLPGLTGSVAAMEVFDDDGPGPGLPALFVGGLFDPPAGATTRALARWDGAAWSDVGAGLALPGGVPGVAALAAFDPDGPGPQHGALAVGGMFTVAGAADVANGAAWNGQGWSALDGGDFGVIPQVPVAAFAPASLEIDPFLTLRLVAVTSRVVVGWSGFWLEMQDPVGGGPGLSINALEPFDADGPGGAPAALYVGGDFDYARPFDAGSLASHSGSSWFPRAQFDGPVRSMAAFNGGGPGGLPPSLFICGDFTRSGTQPLPGIARLDGAGLHDIGSVAARTLARWDSDGAGPLPPLLVAGGAFTQADGVGAARIAAWDGAAWSPLGAGIDGGAGAAVAAIAAWDEDGDGPAPARLFAAGAFESAGGAPASNIARWDGAAWSPLGAGVDGPVRAMAVFDPDGPGPAPTGLYAAGAFTSAGGAPAAAIARWDGAAWSPLGAGLALDGGGAASVTAMAVFDPDGAGPALPALHVAGGFDLAGGVLVAGGVAVWDGAAWRAAGEGTSPTPPLALAAHDVDGAGPAPAVLYAGGAFTAAAGSPTTGIARYSASPPRRVSGGGFWASTRRGSNVAAAITAEGNLPMTFQWRRDGVPLVDGTLASGSVVSGAATNHLRINNLQIPETGTYSLTASNGCGEVTFAETATFSLRCLSDWDGSLSTDSGDISAFLTSWLHAVANGHLGADVDGSGEVNSADISAFLLLWLANVGPAGFC